MLDCLKSETSIELKSSEDNINTLFIAINNYYKDKNNNNI